MPSSVRWQKLIQFRYQIGFFFFAHLISSYLFPRIMELVMYTTQQDSADQMVPAYH